MFSLEQIRTENMRIIERFFLIGAFLCAFVVSGCTTSQPESYLSRDYRSIEEIPKVTQVLVQKEDRKLFLFSGKDIVRSYDVDLGFAPEGHKTTQGDGRTPEGLYYIDRKNDQSQFYLSVGISYPNPKDRAQAARRGVSPGGDIFIHGEATQAARSGTDWTAGCIALPDRLMDEIFALVDIGTPIMISK
jgi:murein L,D-transpeptidase YafK